MAKNLSIIIEEQVAKRYGLEAVYLFGSSLKSRFLNEDIDLALLFEDRQGVEEYFNLTAMFELYLLNKHGDEKKFDLTILNLASPLLKYEVLTSGRPIYYRDIDKLAMFEMRARGEYDDYFYRLRFYDEALVEQIQRGRSL